jgi:aryl-alcohol dehydrogenase-like predicted oxidoreductase
MQKRQLGNSGLEVSSIGFGCMGMSWSYGPPKDKQERVKVEGARYSPFPAQLVGR